MAEKEYIERETLIRYTEKQEVIIKDGTSIADAMRIQGNVFRRCVETCPTADVVPRAEVSSLRGLNKDLEDELEETHDNLEAAEAKAERLEKICNNYALQYGTVTDQQKVIDEAKAEVAREIFAKISPHLPVIKTARWQVDLMNDIAELKKKYTETKNEV